MKNQGFSEGDIENNLRERGISPKEIKDSLSQAKIKSIVSNQGENEEQFPQNQETAPPQAGQEYNYPPQGYDSQGYGSQEYYSQGGYPQEGYDAYAGGSGLDTNTVIEVSEQVFSERIKSIQEEVNAFNEFKSLTEIRLNGINERLKRMETFFDKLQITILEKVGSYGQNLETIKKEMGMMQDSFSKVVNPMIDRAEKKHEEKIAPSTPKRKTSKNKKG